MFWTKKQQPSLATQPDVERVKLPYVGTTGFLLPTVDVGMATEAKKLLGYGILLDGLEIESALRKLDVAPFNRGIVEGYQAKEERRIEKETGWTWNWTRYGIEAYSKPIPPAVLLLATKIRKEIPSAGIFVEALERRSGATADPFLYLEVGNLRWYIASWDEPDFNVVDAQLAYKNPNV